METKTNKLTKLREKFSSFGIDGLLITNEYNRKYMTNFTGSAGAVLISENAAKFLTDFRYVEQAKAQCVGYDLVEVKSRQFAPTIGTLCQEMGIKKLGFEELDVFYKDYVTYKEEISAELIPVSNLVEQLRYVKSAEEIAILQVAADIADATFTHILKFIRAGVTELEVANEMEMFMRKAGAKCSSFDMIIASGWRSALPHGVATSKVIEAGEMVTLDFGAVYNNYISDMTRTVAVGEPNEKLREIYEVVLEAQLAVCEKLKPGISCASADSIARDIITKRGYGKYFGHSLGHGIGLEVHEGPYLSANSSDVLVSGMAVTNEPGIYLPKIGGVRIEDDLIITEDGNYALTISPKELIVL